MADLKVAKIALDIPRSGVFDFAAPDIRLEDVGRLAIVPWGPRKLAGVILDIADHTEVPAEKLRAIVHIQRDWPALTAADLALFRFCAGYYHHAIGAVILNAVPPRLREPRPLVLPVPRRFALAAGGQERLAQPARARALHRILDDIAAGIGDEQTLKSRHAGWAAKIARLLNEGWVDIDRQPVAKTAKPANRTSLVAGPALNAAQQTAVESINGAAGRFEQLLLDGVTGSGKTEVYLHTIARTIEKGGQVLVLMPEINLTPQFLGHVNARLEGARVTALHSALNATERTERYLDAARGVSDVVIGTRLAVFTPMPRLTLIIVDEEHDASFKQQEGLRYSARDVATMRAKQINCPVVLGSATPSLESLANVQRGRCRVLRLPERANPAARL
ncbi:MAG: DEAD/DEAH box helicase, partial [Betaproteobacteria bacterium]|nr:DEAD/DEAH box helicase [Betaproteobacteria bacterium]